MLLFGGERGTDVSGDLWRFHFATDAWERITPLGSRPTARSECTALAVTEAPVSSPPARPRSVERRVMRSATTPADAPSTLLGRLSTVNLAARLSRCSYSVLSNDSAESDAESVALVKSASMHAGVAAIQIQHQHQQQHPPIMRRMPRDPISVPNFASAPLTPVEAARLVFVDSSDDEAETGKMNAYFTLKIRASSILAILSIQMSQVN